MTGPARPALPLVALLLALPLAAWAGEPAGAGTPAAPPPADEASPPPAVAREPAQPSPAGAPRLPPLEPPRWRAAVTFGAGTSYGQSYVMFGGLLGYEVSAGFEVYLDGQYWGGSAPEVGRVAPGINWYAPIPFRPYLGAYYAHWFVGGSEPDQDALGGRAGLTLTSSPRAALGAGLVYERILDCSASCEAWWPELSIGFRF